MDGVEELGEGIGMCQVISIQATITFPSSPLIILPSIKLINTNMLSTVHFPLLYPSSLTLSPCRQMLRELVPLDVLKSYAPEDWKKAIVTQINRHPIRSKEEAKICFLKYICRWQTFGSAFFEVCIL